MNCIRSYYTLTGKSPPLREEDTSGCNVEKGHWKMLLLPQAEIPGTSNIILCREDRGDAVCLNEL
jgi:hypothetical protein